MSRLGAYASTKLNYKLLSKLIIHFFFLVENERKAKTVWTNMHKHTHTHAVFIRLIRFEMDIEYHHVQTIRSYIYSSLFESIYGNFISMTVLFNLNGGTDI